MTITVETLARFVERASNLKDDILSALEEADKNDNAELADELEQAAHAMDNALTYLGDAESCG